jgi:diguanylate cyclase (GGDEF)-like protein/PAS domain S-box-containing protein
VAHGKHRVGEAAVADLAAVGLTLAGIGLLHIDPVGIVTTDAAASAMLPRLPHGATATTLLRLVAPPDRRDALDFARRDGHAEVELALTGSDETAQHVRVRMQQMHGHCATGPCVVLTLTDTTRDRRTLDALRQSEEHLRHTVEFNPQLPWVADPAGNIIDLTDRWLAATGMTREQAMGGGWLPFTHPDDLDRVQGCIVHALTSGEPFDVRTRLKVGEDYRWMRAQGYPLRDADGAVVRWYGYTEDIHEQVLAEERIRWDAEHDTLTGLHNRAMFNHALDEALRHGLQSLRRVGVLLLDIDHFKEVNDLLGHHAGDLLLQRYADQLRQTLPPEATIARLGGDEFAILFPHVTDRAELTRWGNDILRLREPLLAAARSIDCRASIGAAIFPDHGRLCSELLRHADIALYAAKESGRGRLLMFEWAMQEEVRRRVAMVNRARTAVEGGDILAYYQPKICLRTGALTGFEALLRWRDSTGRVQAPATIMAAFEECEVADLLGGAMLDHVVGDLTRWKAMGLQCGSVAINAAPAEFRQTGFAERLMARVAAAGLTADEIEVEVTEGVFLGGGADHAKRAITTLHEAGHRIVLDDFGTGFASLSHLRQLPVDTLKIDRSFIASITEAAGDAAIVSAIVNLGHTLDIKVVAEGIETEAQAEMLRGFGCGLAQGYLFGRPTPAQDIPALIRNWGRAPLAATAV